MGALVAGIVCDRLGRSFYVSVPAMIVGSAGLYAVGLVWLHQALPTPWNGTGPSTLHYGLWPFVLGDLAKIFAAAAIIDPSAPWNRWLESRRGGLAPS
jgi:biotin transporter BioY